MKKIILIAIAFIGLQAIAQQRPERRNNREDRQEKMTLSAEEIATLQTKKMTLVLDLNESQQKEIQKINLENANTRKVHLQERKANKEVGTAKKLSKEDKVKMMNAMLDHKIEVKAKMKKILNPEQYTKWEETQEIVGFRRMGRSSRDARGYRRNSNRNI